MRKRRLAKRRCHLKRDALYEDCTPARCQKLSPLDPPFLAGCWLTRGFEISGISERDFVQADILDRGPDNSQTTVLGREDINLIGALAHIAKQTLDGIG